MLQRLQRSGTTAALSEPLACFVMRRGRGLHRIAQLLHRPFGAGPLGLDALELPLHRLDPVPHGLQITPGGADVDRVAFGQPCTPPRLELVNARFQVLNASLLRVHRSRRPPLPLAQRVELLLEGLYGFLDFPELALRIRRPVAQPDQCRIVMLELRSEFRTLLPRTFDLKLRRLQALLLVTHRFGQLVAAAPDRTDGLLDARDLRPRIEHLAIAAVVGIRRLGVRGPPPLELRLDPALLGKRGVQPRLLVRNLPCVAVRFRVQRPPLERKMLRLELDAPGLERTILLGERGLTLEVSQPARELVTQVVQAIEVVDRVAHPVFRLATAFLVLRDSGRLFEKITKVFRFRLDDSRDHALLDDRVAAWADPGSVKHVHDVAAPAPRAVQPVRRLSIARELPAYRDFVVRRKATADPPVQIVEDELDAGPAHRLARARPVEYDVGHGVAAQAPRGDFAHHPTHRVNDVRLAPAVRTDHSDHIAGKIDRRGIDEGLETR